MVSKKPTSQPQVIETPAAQPKAQTRASQPIVKQEPTSNGVNGGALPKPGSYKFKTPDTLPGLELPEDSYWFILVTIVEAVDDITIRLLGPKFSEALDSLADEMLDFYSVNAPRVVPKVEKFIPG